MIDPTDAESAVRSYLYMLEDPTQLVDAKEVERLQRDLVAAEDPIVKLRLLTGLERALIPDRAAYEAAFIGHAKSWATENGISVSSFQQMGVSDATLHACGLLRPTRARSVRPADDNPNARAVVTKEMIKSYIAGMTSPFTMAELAAGAGGSPMTLRRAVKEAIAEGTLTAASTRSPFTGRGRGAIVYAAIAGQRTGAR